MTERPEQPERPDPLHRLDVFSRVTPSNQWNDIVRRSAEPESAPLHAIEPPRHRAMWALVAAAAAALVIAGGVLLADRGDDGRVSTVTNPPATSVGTSVPSVTGPPTTMTPTTSAGTTPAVRPSAPPPVESTAPPSTAPELAAPPLAPWCDETIGGPVATSPSPDEYRHLVPIAGEPAMTITLPNGAIGGSQDTSIARGVQIVDGGILVLVQDAATAAPWQLVAINFDGSIRWRRCGSEQAWELHAGGGSASVKEDADGWSAWRTFDIDTGASVEPLGLDPRLLRQAVTERYVLVGNDSYSGDFQIADLVTGEVTELDDPPVQPAPGFAFRTELIERDGGSFVVTVADGLDVLAVHVDGAWHTDRETLLREVPPLVYETVTDDPSGLGTGVLARDPLGATVWFHDTVNGIRAEAWSTGILGDVVLTNECRRDDPNEAFGCADPWHIVLDLATGDVLWERPGFVGVSLSDGSIAMVADDDGWSLVDVRSGDVLQQTLPPFMTGCCGEDDHLWSGRDGGIVWSVDYQTLRLYFPEPVGRPTVEVDLGT